MPYSPAMRRFCAVGSKAWNRVHFHTLLEPSGRGEWLFIDEPAKLSQETLEDFKPEFIFFLHWSWIVPAEVHDQFECVVFHMTDLPYGRGGSPLQNLIVRGHRETQLSAIKMTSTLDGGPIFMKCPLSLEGSTAEEIYVRASKLSCELALRIIDDSPIPRPQTGEPTEFKRRKPKEGSIHNAESLEQIHDFIRMLDADGYPPAFLEYGGFRLEFRRSSRYHDRVVAEVTIRRPGESS